MNKFLFHSDSTFAEVLSFPGCLFTNSASHVKWLENGTKISVGKEGGLVVWKAE